VLHMHVGFAEFLTFAAMAIVFCAVWRTLMYAAKRRGYENIAGAMAFLL
jgi:cbb3-type cytochrome oxidase subunit 3